MIVATFNLEDRVEVTAGAYKGMSFIVSGIKLERGSLWFSGIPEDKVSEYVFPESELRHYQEPQKKKLYAFTNGYDVVFQIPNVDWLINKKEVHYSRIPEFDIEYPLETK